MAELVLAGVGGGMAILQLAEMFYKQSRKWSRAMKTMRNAPQQLEDIWNDTTFLMTLLRTLGNSADEAMENRDPHELEMRDMRRSLNYVEQQARVVYAAIKKLLAKSAFDTSVSTVGGWVERIRWLFQQTHVQILQALMTKAKQDVHMLNSGLMLEALLRQLKELRTNNVQVSVRLQNKMCVPSHLGSTTQAWLT
jgi:hypothetical protein